MTKGHTQTNQPVSVIGLGAMGSGIASTFLDAGCQVSVWNRSRKKIDALASLGAHACDSPTNAIQASPHIVVCLTGYAAWENVIQDHRLQNHLEDKFIIQLTGGTIDEVQTHASLIEENRGRIADGALMCFPRQLGTEDASLLMAGKAEVLEECDGLLRLLDPNWTNLGDDLTKPSILSRSLTAGIVTSLIGLLNGMAICRAGGIPLELFMQHMEKAESIVPAEKRRLIEAVREGRTEETQASIKTWTGAHETIHSVAEQLGTNLVLQDSIKFVLQEGQRLGLGEHDLSAIIDVFISKKA